MAIGIISKVVPYNNGNFATHDSKYGKGGWVSVNALVDMYALSALRLSAGMACRVISLNQTYILSLDLVTWVLDAGSRPAPVTSKLKIIEQYATESGPQLIINSDQINIQQTGYSLYINGLLQRIASYQVVGYSVIIDADSSVIAGDFMSFSFNEVVVLPT
jgi:hypothetical protein